MLLFFLRYFTNYRKLCHTPLVRNMALIRESEKNHLHKFKDTFYYPLDFYFNNISLSPLTAIKQN